MHERHTPADPASRNGFAVLALRLNDGADMMTRTKHSLRTDLAHRLGLPGAFALFAALMTAVFASFALAGCQTYDTLVEKDQVCEQRWADIDAQLQRDTISFPIW